MNAGPEEFIITYSGLDTEVNTVPLSSGGSFYYAVDNWTYSIPTLEVNYKYRGTTYSTTYYEGVDYAISGLNYIVWGNTLPTAEVHSEHMLLA
jgi:hypothetical protein